MLPEAISDICPFPKVRKNRSEKFSTENEFAPIFDFFHAAVK